MAKEKQKEKIWTNKNRLRNKLFSFLRKYDEFVIFDNETTGLSTHDKIIQISGIKVGHHWTEIDKFNTFINPTPNIILPKITEITGITVDDVKDAPLENEVLPKFNEWSKNAGFFAYNSQFDADMVSAGFKRVGIDRNIDHFDVLEAVRVMLPGLERYKLIDVAEYMGVVPEDASFHNSMFDVEMTLEILKNLVTLYKEYKPEDDSGKIRPKIYALNPWSKGSNQRIYIPTSAGTVYFNKIGKYFGAGTAKEPLDIDTLDMNYIESECLKIAWKNGYERLEQVKDSLNNY